jgi:hypothetical protein
MDSTNSPIEHAPSSQTGVRCERSVSTEKYEQCPRLATHTISWVHQDGDREWRNVCERHAREEQFYWSSMSWDAKFAVEPH